MEEKLKIWISIPVSPNHSVLEVGLVRWLIQMTHHPDCIVGVDIVEGKPIDSVRNDAARRFLKSNYDIMFCVDSDIIPPDHTINTLVESMQKLNCDAMGGLCYSFQYGEPFAVAMDKDNNGGYRQSPLLNKTRYIPCEATGGACVLLTRKLVETVGPQWRTQYNEDGVLSWGQDFWYFEQATKLGFKLYIDSNVVCGHIGRIDLKRVGDLIMEVEDRAKRGAFEAVLKIVNGQLDTATLERIEKAIV